MEGGSSKARNDLDWDQRRRGSTAGTMFADDAGSTWQEFQDEQCNVFYYNIQTGHTQWEKPFVPPSSSSSSSPYATSSEANPNTITTTSSPEANNTNTIVNIDSIASTSSKDSSNLQKQRHQRKRPKLQKRLSTRTFRVASNNNRCYSLSSCFAALTLVIFLVVVVFTGSSENPRNVIGIPWEDVSNWTLLLIGISVGWMTFVIVIGCVCFRFRICENYQISQMNTPSSNGTVLSQVDIDYDEHLAKAKAHLKEDHDLNGDDTENSKKKKKKNDMQRKLSLKHNVDWKFENSAEAIAHRETARRHRKNRNNMSHHHQHLAYHEEEDADGDDEKNEENHHHSKRKKRKHGTTSHR